MPPSMLCAKGRFFRIRVGGNVRLITPWWPNARTRRQRDLVYVWPQRTRTTRPSTR
jgi:hypothetical protein